MSSPLLAVLDARCPYEPVSQFQENAGDKAIVAGEQIILVTPPESPYRVRLLATELNYLAAMVDYRGVPATIGRL